MKKMAAAKASIDTPFVSTFSQHFFLEILKPLFWHGMVSKSLNMIQQIIKDF